ncbi:hypothetical protein P7K49_004299 [Saguinus oedipus]|uniref:Uncharacterized protein n=1 Tax=Saguinus oedipus TaxID=9490 RepID=A0ABQ9W9C5_SAGOE|nr:hypothetical protein P7K49_004299 [Saguinus oedipus]
MVLMWACLSPKPLSAHFTNAQDGADAGLSACQCSPSSITPYDFTDAQEGAPHYFTNAQDNADVGLSPSQCCPISITPHHFTDAQDGADASLSASQSPHTPTAQMPRMVLMWACLPANAAQAQ